MDESGSGSVAMAASRVNDRACGAPLAQRLRHGHSFDRGAGPGAIASRALAQ